MDALSQQLNEAFGDAARFHMLIDSNWPAIDRALKAHDDMLAALKATQTDYYSTHTIEVRQQIEAAIAKAEGGRS